MYNSLRRFLLGIDIGTNGLKLGIFGLLGNLISFANIPCEISHPYPKWAEFNPEEWWQAFLLGLQELKKQSPKEVNNISALGFSALFPALFPLNKQGKPLRPAILYCDKRSDKQAYWIHNRLAEKLLIQRTGNPAVPGICSLTSMLWIKQNEPKIYQKTRWFVNANSYLGYLLTEQLAMDWTNASETGLFDSYGKKGWDAELCNLFGIPIKILPKAIPSVKLLGKIPNKIAEQTGLPKGIPVIIGGGDTACSALGSGVVNNGQIFATSGTTDVIATCFTRQRFDRRFINICHVIPGRWLVLGEILASGASLKWFGNQFCQHEVEIGRKLNISDYSLMDELAKNTRPGANGVIFLSYMIGEHTPILDPKAKGIFLGLSITSTKGELIRAILEGVGFANRHVLEEIEKLLGKKTDSLFITGGCNQSMLWNQIKADITGRNIIATNFSETALLGAAMLAGIGSGIFRTYQDAVNSMQPKKIKKKFHPQKKYQKLYDELYKIYRGIYQDTKQIFS